MMKTERHVREDCARTLLAKRRSQNPKYPTAKVEEELSTPEYQQWIAERVAEARKAGALLTEQQYQDLTAKRALAEGDRVRYLGPTRIERSLETGRLVTRIQGSTGTIASLIRAPMGTRYTFVPDVSHEVRNAADAGLDVHVLTLETSDWRLFERIL